MKALILALLLLIPTFSYADIKVTPASVLWTEQVSSCHKIVVRFAGERSTLTFDNGKVTLYADSTLAYQTDDNLFVYRKLMSNYAIITLCKGN